jgi:4-alpha-glucanotransferase
MDPSLTVASARVGSPPDMFNSKGQDWGLAPLSPKALADRDYRPLREAFEALTRHAGAVRIDHAMGLARLWWIPDGVSSAGGGYVRYPLGAMIDSVAAASQANDCLVVGEDLGTVPAGFRGVMEEAQVLSYRVLYFERHGDIDFLPPEAYPPLALACISTHDLATLAGWWRGLDIRLREEVGTQDAAATRRDLGQRERDRLALVIALADARLLPSGMDDLATGEAGLPETLPDSLAIALHRFISRTPSLLVAVQLDDMLGSEKQSNLPGTTDQYPNWRIRSSTSIEDIAADERFRRVAAAMREERPSAT